MTIQIRKLKVADRKKLSSMIDKLVDTAGESSLLNMISSAVSHSSPVEGTKVEDDDKSSDSAIKVGIKLLQMLLKTLEDETHEWFADLIGVSKEDFLELPIDTELIIIKQMTDAEESSSFFTIASELYKKIESLQMRFSGAKNR